MYTENSIKKMQDRAAVKIMQMTLMKSASTIRQDLQEFIFIPRRDKKLARIPCLLLPHRKSLKLLIYLHGNGEDLITTKPQLEKIRLKLKVSVLAIEYPQYERIYMNNPDVKRWAQQYENHVNESLNGGSPNQFIAMPEFSKDERPQPSVSVEQVLDDIHDVYLVLHNQFGIRNDELIIYGRSIGTGFAL